MPTLLTRTFITAVASLLSLGAATVLTARLLGGRPPAPLPQLAAMVPAAAGVGLAGLILALVTRRPPLIAICAAVFLALALLAAPSPGDLRHSRSSDQALAPGGHPDQLVVMTINAYIGRADPGAIVDLVRDQRVDLLAVQELTPDLRQRLHDAGLDQLLPACDALAGDGASGTGVWSRYPITVLEPVPGMLFAAPRVSVHQDSAGVGTGYERRGIAWTFRALAVWRHSIATRGIKGSCPAAMLLTSATRTPAARWAT